MPLGELVALGRLVDLDLVGGSLIAPLVAVHVMVGRGVLEARRLAPVERTHDGCPGGDWGQLLLADVVVEAAAVTADTAAEHQRDDPGPVDQVGVIPVIDPGADDDRAFAFGGFGG